MTEEWKWISGYEGLYQISNMGRIKSFFGNKDGYIYSNTNKNGWYFTVNLYSGDRKTRVTRRIHRLVAEAFIGEIPKGYEVNHIDGNKQNNVVTNLEIVSKEEHQQKTLAANPDYINGMFHYNREVRAKRVRQYTLDGLFLAEYVNASVASQITGVCQRNILQVASQDEYKPGLTRSQAGGYVWRYAEGGGPKCS